MIRSRPVAVTVVLVLAPLFGACAHRTSTPLSSSVDPPAARIEAAAFDPAGERLWFVRRVGDECRLERISLRERLEQPVAVLPFCPEIMLTIDDGWVLSSSSESAWFAFAGEAGEIVPTDDVVVAARTRTDFVRSGEQGLEWVRDGVKDALPGSLRADGLRILTSSEAIIGVMKVEQGEQIVRWRPDELVVLTEPVARIESFDLSPDQRELAFSAWREESFDVGLASTDGGAIHWVGPERFDEVQVRWAPRGNKVSYVMKTELSSLIRTVHIPTGFMMIADLGAARVDDGVWEPAAERMAVVLSSIDASSRIEMIHYDGTGRQTLVEPSATAPRGLDLQPVNGAVLVPPPVVRYGHRYPLVIMIDDEVSAWKQARGRLLEQSEAGMILLGSDVADPAAWLRREIDGLGWVDRDRVYLVAPKAGPGDLLPLGSPVPWMVITGGGRIPGGVERFSIPGGGRLVSISASSPEAVESVAAELILTSAASAAEHSRRR